MDNQTSTKDQQMETVNEKIEVTLDGGGKIEDVHFEDDPNLDTLTRQCNYMQNVNKYAQKIIPEKWHHQWCLLFGGQVIYHFDTEQEALEKLHDSSVALCLVSPLTDQPLADQ